MRAFFDTLHKTYPIKIMLVLTDSGEEFADRFTNEERRPSGDHKFDRCCKDLGLELRLCSPRHPQTNGMVERFNGCINEVLVQTRFDSAAQPEATLMNYTNIYGNL